MTFVNSFFDFQLTTLFQEAKRRRNDRGKRVRSTVSRSEATQKQMSTGIHGVCEGLGRLTLHLRFLQAILQLNICYALASILTDRN